MTQRAMAHRVSTWLRNGFWTGLGEGAAILLVIAIIWAALKWWAL